MTMPPPAPEPVQNLQPRAAAAPLEFTQVGAVAQSPSLRGAMVLGATIQAPPLLGYYYSLAVMGDESAGKRIIDAVAEFAATTFKTMLDAGYKSFGLLRGDPQTRLNFYLTQKTPEMWAEQRAKYPQDFTEDITDFNNLVARVEKGELVDPRMPVMGALGGPGAA